MSRRIRLLLAPLAPIALASLACGPQYATLDIDVLSAPPVVVDVRDTSIELPVGVAVHVKAAPISNSNKRYGNERMTLDTNDSGVFEVQVTAHPRRFVFVGVSPGETCMRVVLEGVEEDCIPVEISAQ